MGRPSLKILIGQKFSKLTVIEEGISRHGHTTWKCQCDCGNIKIVVGSHLKAGYIKSCGDSKCRPNFQDLTGQKFGRLTAIEFSHIEKGHASIWKYQCDCGKFVLYRSDQVKSGHTKTCGIGTCRANGLEFGLSAKRTVYTGYKRGASKRGLSFDLDFDRFIEITQRNCHYCGELPSNRMHPTINTGDFVYNGIDRVDNTKGYFLENCVACCRKCNYAKRDMGEDEWNEWLDKIIETQLKVKVKL